MKKLFELTAKQEEMVLEFAAKNNMRSDTLMDAATKLAELPMFLFPSNEAWQEWDEMLSSLAIDHNITSI